MSQMELILMERCRQRHQRADVAVGINPLEVSSKKACSQTDMLKGRVAGRDKMRLEHSSG